MLYLSRLVPDVRTAAARRDLANPYDMHRTLMRAFPTPDDDGPGRVLWRTDTNRSTGGLHVIVQSTRLPDWSQLDQTWFASSPQQREFSPVFRPGQCLRFRLRANPTRRAGNSHDDPVFVGKRVPIMNSDGQLAWLARKAERGGFQLVGHNGADSTSPFDVAISHTDTVRSRKPGPDSGRASAIDHYAVLFDGRLQIADRDRFIQTIAQGIGPAKAFGFGLLSIAPVQ
jgi:CRISPR system Cascade subunit CasE